MKFYTSSCLALLLAMVLNSCQKPSFEDKSNTRDDSLHNTPEYSTVQTFRSLSGPSGQTVKATVSDDGLGQLTVTTQVVTPQAGDDYQLYIPDDMAMVGNIINITANDVWLIPHNANKQPEHLGVQVALVVSCSCSGNQTMPPLPGEQPGPGRCWLWQHPSPFGGDFVTCANDDPVGCTGDCILSATQGSVNFPKDGYILAHAASVVFNGVLYQ